MVNLDPNTMIFCSGIASNNCLVTIIFSEAVYSNSARLFTAVRKLIAEPIILLTGKPVLLAVRTAACLALGSWTLAIRKASPSALVGDAI